MPTFETKPIGHCRSMFSFFTLEYSVLARGASRNSFDVAKVLAIEPAVRNTIATTPVSLAIFYAAGFMGTGKPFGLDGNMRHHSRLGSPRRTNGAGA